MITKHGPSIYFASDKAFYDALNSKKITSEMLIEYLHQKNIYISSSLDKKNIIDYIIKFNFDYNDYIWFSSKLENIDRKQRSESRSLPVNTNIELLNDVISSLSNNLLAENIACNHIVSENKNDELKINICYIEHDLTKAELRQKQKISDEIILVIEDKNLIVRYPSNSVCKSISSSIFNLVNEKTLSTEEPIEVNLEAFIDAEIRTNFFVKLKDYIDGYYYDDVISIDVNKINREEDEDGFEEKMDRAKEEYLLTLKKVILNGQSILDNKHFKELSKDGFYITKMTWTIIKDEVQGDKYTIEAQFGDADNCREFKYLVKYVYPDNGNGPIATSRIPSKKESSEISYLIEKARNKAHKEIIETYGS